MTKEEKTNKIITTVLIIIILLAAITIVYVSLLDDEDKSEPIKSTNGESVSFSLIYDEIKKDYTLDMLENLESYTGNGGIIKTGWFPDIVVEGPFNYTGVKIKTLLDLLPDLPEDYQIKVNSSDGKFNEYNISQINGNIEVYNGTSNKSYSSGGVTMILAYKKEGEYLGDTEGPFRIVFVNNGDFISSKLWAKFVVSIEII